MKIVKMYERDIVSANILRVAAGTTGFKGGDSGHGGRTFIEIQNESCSDIRVEVFRDSYGDAEGVRIELGGDTELETMIEALDFIVKTLRREAIATEENRKMAPRGWVAVEIEA